MSTIAPALTETPATAQTVDRAIFLGRRSADRYCVAGFDRALAALLGAPAIDRDAYLEELRWALDSWLDVTACRVATVAAFLTEQRREGDQP